MPASNINFSQMGSHFPSQNEPQYPQQEHVPSTKHTKASTINTTRVQGPKGKGLEDKMSRYFGSGLPWSHVDAISSSRGAVSQESDKKD